MPYSGLAPRQAAAALLSPPYCRASADTLCPWQVALPGVPANLSGVWIKMPYATGILPTGIGEPITVSVAVAITHTLLETEFAT